MVKYNWQKYLPQLSLWIEFPGLLIRTCIMYRRYETQTIEYVLFDIQIYKWKFEFSLYDKLRRLK